jgi:SNF2 family DNA or RNA helicase
MGEHGMGNSKSPNPQPRRKGLRRVLVDQTLTIRPEIHVPQPSFGSLANITPFSDGFFHHPITVNPEIAKEAYREAGLRLDYSPQALKQIQEHRSVEFEYDTDGFVWVRPLQGYSLKDILDDQTLKTYLTWSAYYDDYRLRQAGSLKFAQEAFERQGIVVKLRGFPRERTHAKRLRLPSNINVTLYPFQRKAVQFILDSDGRACVFDEMGLGKTITATTAVLELAKQHKAFRVMIVAPNAVVEQWRGELVEKFNLNPTLVTSKTKLRERMALYDDPLAILNYELLRTDLELILQKAFDTLILDEVTRVKNWDTQTSEAVKRLITRNVIALTGTPLENHLGELYNIVNIVRPGFFGRYNEDFLARYTIKISGQGWQASRPLINPETVSELRKQLVAISIRRTKAQVLRQLPALTMQYVYTEPARNQRMIYDILQAGLGETIVEEYMFSARSEEGPNPFTANRIRLYTLLREACADISMIAGYLRRKQRENTKDAIALRESAIFRRLIRVVSKLEPENAKLVELKELVKDLSEQDHKMVVFSQYVPVVNLIQEELTSEGTGTLVYHGQLSEDTRTRTLKEFKENSDFRVLASTDAGQFGLNLQAADVVVNYDLPWNPARLQQRIARLHRIGQINKVLAVNFVVKGTVEEHVRDVLERKRKLFRDVTVSEMAESEDLSLDDLRNVFGFDMRRLADKIREKYGLRIESRAPNPEK